MDEKPDQIIGHIEEQRDQLGRNLNELETRVRETADWRTWYDRNPMMVMGAALGGGLLLGSMVGGKSGGIKRRIRRSSHRGYRMTGDILGSSTAGISATSAAHLSQEHSSDTSKSGGRTYSSGEQTSAAETSGQYKSGEHTSGEYTSPAYASAGGYASGEQLSGEHTSGRQKGSSHSSGGSRVRSAVSSITRSESWHDVSDTVEDVKAALIAFGLVKAKEFLNQTIPGFDTHLNEARQKREQRQGHSGGDAGEQKSHESAASGHDDGDAFASGMEQRSSETGRHLYTPAGDQIVRSGSYSSDPVGTFTP